VAFSIHLSHQGAEEYPVERTWVAVMVWLRPATKAPRGRPSSCPGVQRRMERNRQKLVGRDNGSLTEQQTKGTGTTMVQMRRKHNTNCTTQRIALHHCCCDLPSRE